MINKLEEPTIEIRRKKSSWMSTLHDKMKKRIPSISQLANTALKSSTYGYGYDLHSENYFNEKNRVKILADLERILTLKNKETDFYTKTRIAPLSISFPLDINKVKSKLGGPDFILENPKIENHCVFFYKIKSWKYKMNYQFHFYNKKLFYVNVEFSNIDFSRLDDRNKVLQMVLEKYMEKDTATIKQFPVVLEDADNNKVVVSNDLKVNMHYFSKDVKLENELKGILDEVVMKKMNKYNSAKNNFMKIL